MGANKIEIQGANRKLSNLLGTIINTSLISDTDSTDDLGSSSKYWANTYTDKIYLNSTASLDGSVAGYVNVTAAMVVTSPINETSTTKGVHIGAQADTPRIGLFDGTASRNWQIDNYWDGANAHFRWFLPGATKMDIDASNLSLNIDVVMNSAAPKIITLSNKNLSLVPNGTGYTIIGDAGTTSHSFNTNDDLLVSGRVEVNGCIYVDGTTTINSSNIGIAITAGGIDINGESHFYAGSYSDPLDGTYGVNKIYTAVGADYPITGQAIGLTGNAANNRNTYGCYFINTSVVSGSGVNYGIYVIGTMNYFSGIVNSAESYQVDGTQVISNRVVDARCDDAINSGDATTDGVIDALRDAMIAHGLIAAA